jgi:hypothetical protein
MNTSTKFYWLLLVILAIPLQACSTTNSAKAIEGRVVDAETHLPLEGVNVVSRWYMHIPGFNGEEEVIKLIEAVTDKDGRFYFPAWGPEAVPRDIPWDAFKSFQYPAIEFFKSGYEPMGVSNQITGSRPKPGTTESEWNGKTIEIKKFKGRMEVYALMVRTVVSGYSNCGWKKMPKAMVAVFKEAERLNQQKIDNSLPTIRDLENDGEKCGSASEFFKEYMK